MDATLFDKDRTTKMTAIDLELTRAAAEVKELEARLRVVPMNDIALAQALERALASKRERLDRLKAKQEDPDSDSR
ncbi:MAG TPA: hypothetical protein VG015_00390 [Candidatus Dormibacteraeota bacterium]|nr:hypothetical protein [Candidatus Dormibacteraeota bacterium]